MKKNPQGHSIETTYIIRTMRQVGYDDEMREGYLNLDSFIVSTLYNAQFDSANECMKAIKKFQPSDNTAQSVFFDIKKIESSKYNHI